MKLTTLILIGTLLQVSAASFAQRLSMQKNNASLKEVFNEIKRQTGYNVVWDAEQLKDAKPITANFKNAELAQVLESVMNGQPLDYTISDKTIVIRRKEPSLFSVIQSAAKNLFQSIDVRGRVVDKDGNGLAGATISVKGGKQSTTSGSNGDFMLRGVEENAGLVVSYIGYKPYEVKAKENLGNVRLEENISELEEVTINKGYYTTSRVLNTGNVRSVNAEDITKQPVSDPLAALQGRIPGLLVQQTSGAPGREFNILIRGQNSIANGNEPLYLIDGVQFNSTPLNYSEILGAGVNTSPLNSISPADIESITILKDADATAIYGSRGSNGVILITTKKGKSGETHFSINTYHGVGKATQRLDMMNTEEYLAMRREAFKNDNRQPGASDYDLNGAYDLNKNTDWQNVLFGGRAPVGELQSALSGGNDKTQFRVGMGYRREGNVFPGKNHMNKINSLMSITHRSPNGRFNMTISGNYVSGLNTMPTMDITRYLTLAPNSPDIYDSSGNLNWQNNSWENPFSELIKRYSERAYNLGGNSKLSYEIIKGLKIEANLGYNRNSLEQKNIIPFSSLNPTTSDPKLSRVIVWTNNEVNSWVIEPQLAYSKGIWIGNVDILIGTTLQETAQESIAQSANGFADDEQIESIVAGTSKNVFANNPSQYRYNAIYGRVGYNIQNRYILNLTARRDGSSRFGPRKQFGNFGAVGAAWTFSKERWLKDNSIISYGKLRASYGITGNDKLGDYEYLSTYSYTSTAYQGYTGLNPARLTNPEYGWETLKKLEIALEVSFLKNRISLDVSLYRNRTGNQLVGYPLPLTTGFNTVTANLPAVVQNTGTEVELNADIFRNGNFNWISSFNISVPRNKLVSYPDIESSSFATRYTVGMPLSVAYVYQYKGINAETGLFAFDDKNRDGQITSALDRSFIDRSQKYFGGWNNSLSYKSFRFDAFFSFVKQTAQNYLLGSSPGTFSGGLGNQIREVTNRNLFQPYTTGSGTIFRNNGFFNNSTGRYTDASFIRLKNVMLSWTLPLGKTWNKVLKSGSLFVTGQNLLTITKYKGLDPEIGVALRTPPLRVLAVGMNINF